MRRPSATTVYFALEFAYSLPAYVVVAVYLVREVGLSPLQLILVGTVMEATVFLFEIPTGAFADTYGRKRSVVVAYILMGVAYAMVGLIPEFVPILIAWALWGFARTFLSGAFEAWITDEVGRERVGSVFMRAERISFVGAIVGIAGSVALATYDLQLPVVVGGVVLIVAGLAAIPLMPETAWRPRERGESHAARELAKTVRAGAVYTRNQPILLLILGATFFAGAASEAFDRLWEAHFIRDVGLPEIGSLDSVVWFGIIGVSALLLGLVATTWLIRRFQHAPPEQLARLLLVFTAIMSVAQIGFGLAQGLAVAISLYLLTRLMRFVVMPIYMTWLNQQIDDSSVRATVISMAGQADAVGETAGGPFLGLIGNAWGIRAALVAGGLLLAPAIGLYGRALRHGGKEPELEELPVAAAP